MILATDWTHINQNESMKMFFLCLVASIPAMAQYSKGDMLLNLGIGADIDSRAVPGVAFEYGFGKYISAGVQSDFYTYRSSHDGLLYTSVPTAVRASYHFGKHFLKIRTLDLYGGAALGLMTFRDGRYPPVPRNKYYFGPDDGPYFGLYAGARYYFQPKFAVFTELGHKVSWLKVGVSFRFKARR
jgi:hypothetical protein